VSSFDEVQALAETPPVAPPDAEPPAVVPPPGPVLAPGDCAALAWRTART
jgi:hypothetical protein